MMTSNIYFPTSKFKKNGVPVVKIAEKSHLQAAGLWKLKPPEEFREPPGHGCHGPQPQQGFITMFRIKMAMSFRGPIPHFQRQVTNCLVFFPDQIFGWQGHERAISRAYRKKPCCMSNSFVLAHLNLIRTSQ